MLKKGLNIRFRFQAILFLVFLVVNLFLFLAKTPGGELTAATDWSRYLYGARAILQYGAMVELERPSVLSTWNTPLYPVYLSGFMYLFGENAGLQAAVFAQVFLLYATGLVVRSILSTYAWPTAALAQCITLFNPNSLFTAQLVQTETLFTLFVILGVSALFRFALRPGVRPALWAGVLMGLGSLTRPVLFFAVPLLVVLMPLAALTGSGRVGGRVFLRWVLWSLLAVLVAGCLTAPWLVRNYRATGVAAFTSNSGEYLWDNIFEVYRAHGSFPTEELVLRKNGVIRRHSDGVPHFERLSEMERSRVLFKAGVGEMVSLPPSAMVKAEAISLLRLYVSGGSGNVWRLFGLENEQFNRMLEKRGFRSYLSGLTSFLHDAAPGYLALHFLPILLALALRVAGVVGVIRLFRHREWKALVIMIGVLLYFTAFYVFLGQSRFRVPLEPVLAMLAAVGFCGTGRPGEKFAVKGV